MIDVGIVMPVYTQDSKIFRKAIQSVLRQSYRGFQLVIVIDGVTPNVLRIARYYARKDSRVKVMPQARNRGTATALNIGFAYLMRKRRIKYLTWVSSDNIYYPSFVRVLRNQLKNSPPHVGLAYSKFRFINGRGRALNIQWAKNLSQFLNQPRERLVDYYFIGYSFMYKKQFAQMIDGYQLTPVEDYDYFLRLTEHCDIVYVDRVLMSFRLESPHSNSRQIAISKEKGRNRRFIMYQIMQMARQRRNISPPLTVVFPVYNSSEETIYSLELLLDQSFSNYKLLVYDASQDQSYLPVLGTVPDVRVQYFWLPNASLRDIAANAMLHTDTPYVMFYRSGTDTNFSHLSHLSELLAPYGIGSIRYDTGYNYAENNSFNPELNYMQLDANNEPEIRKIYATDVIKPLLLPAPAPAVIG